MSDTFDLNRENNIDANVDALGKKWIIHFNKQNGLCHARPEPDRSDAVIPKDLKGQWTKPSLLAPRIKKYVTDTWDTADKAMADAARIAQAAKEAEARRKAEAKAKAPVEKKVAKKVTKVKNDKGSATN